MRLFLLISCLALFSPLSAQKKFDKYRIEFTDKDNNPYSIFHPQEFLSPKAIERRKMQGISIDETDLPVTPQYLSELRATGAQVINVSKWFNSAIVQADEKDFAKIEQLPFVKSTTVVGKYRPQKYRFRKDKKRDPVHYYARTRDFYGYAGQQIRMLNGHILHDMGHRGEGVLVAVLDGGFTNVDIMPFFDSLRADGRLLDSYDFVYDDDYAYEASSHGSQVLSTMASNLPGLMVGTAPDAGYICLRTEETGSELVVEEDNWAAGVEYADSLGASVVNSSLGYTTFDKKRMNHTYEDMNGDVCRSTLAADMAAKKGMLIVNSAGNSGGDTWRYIGAPADGDSVMAVAAVDRYRKKVYFSSFGPASDGDGIKPNVAARGLETVVASLYSYQVDSASGTSFAAPVMAGMAASLWSAFPEKTNMDIMEAIEMSANQAYEPDDKLGYGIPDFYWAYQLLSDNIINLHSVENFIHNKPVKNELTVQLQMPSYNFNEVKYEIVDSYGKVLAITTKEYLSGQYVLEKMPVEDLPAGTYCLHIRLNGRSYQVGFFKI